MSILTPDRDLAKLNDEMRTRVDRFLKGCEDKGLRVKVSEAYRTKARQRWLYSFGRFGKNKTLAPVTWTMDSMHLSGKAIDIFFDNGKNIYQGNWDAVYDIAERYGLESLFRLSGTDRPHLQMNEHWKPSYNRRKHEDFFIKWGIVTTPKDLDKSPTREEMYKIDYELDSRARKKMFQLEKRIKSLERHVDLLRAKK